MLTIEEIRIRLRDRRPSVVADAIGVNRNTISRIRDGADANPGYRIVKALSDYLQGGAHDAS